MSNDIRFVRVQNDVHGMHTDAEGNLILRYQRDANRNTVHFAVNSIVEDHSYGKFNYDSNGNLVGNVIIITNPSEMVAPAALNQVDTWFRWSSDNNERTLNVGKATIVVKEGMKVPDSVNALFFDGTVEDRDRLVKEHFEKLNIPMEKCGFRDWVDKKTSNIEWAQATKLKLYGDKAKDIYVGMHDGSPDGRVECCSVSGLLQSFKESNEIVQHGEYDIPYISLIKNKAERSTSFIKDFLNNLPPDEKLRVGKHYELQLENIIKDMKEAIILDKKLVKEREINYLNQLVGEFPGMGDFYIANAIDKQPIKLTAEELKFKITDGSINGNDHFWRYGFKTDWVTIDKTIFYESLESIKELSKSDEPIIVTDMKSALDKMSLFRKNLKKNTTSSALKPE